MTTVETLKNLLTGKFLCKHSYLFIYFLLLATMEWNLSIKVRHYFDMHMITLCKAVCYSLTLGIANQHRFNNVHTVPIRRNLTGNANANGYRTDTERVRERERNGYRTDTERILNGYRTDTER